jgi:hypothetical protein
MTVADLDEVEVRWALMVCCASEGARYRNAPDEAPNQSRTGPGHAFEKPATIYPVVRDRILIGCHSSVCRFIPRIAVVVHNISSFAIDVGDLSMQTAHVRVYSSSVLKGCPAAPVT